MKRALAVVAAVALVVAAVLVRNRLDGDGGGGEGGRVRLVCGPAVAAACRELAGDGVSVVVEDEATTAARLVALKPGRSPGFDAWLAVGPWPAMVAEQRRAAGGDPVPLGEPSRRLARSPATIVARDDRVAALEEHCGGAVDWACIGDVAGGPWTAAGGPATWGTLKPGQPSPDRGDGLVVLSQAVSSELGTTDYASNDFTDDPELTPWFDRLVGAVKDSSSGAGTPLERFLVAPATFGVVGAIEAESAPSVARAADGEQFTVIYPEPVVTADVALTPRAGTSASDVLDRLGTERLDRALAAAGWRVPGQRQADGVGGGPDLSSGSGLPGPGVLSALRQRWEEVR